MLIATIVIAAIVGGAAGVGATLGVQRLTASPTRPNVPSGTTVQVSQDTAVANVVQRTSSAVVAVLPQPGAAAGGSGFLVSSDGYIVTNVGAVAGATHLTVMLANDAHAHDARPVAFDCDTGLAVLKVDQVSNLSTVSFGDSSALGPGQLVVLLGGAPPYQSVVTQGLLSGVNRASTIVDPVTPTRTLDLTGTLVTDTQFGAGFNGGPLLNLGDQVIGLLVRGDDGGQPVTFAIASNAIQAEVQNVLQSGQIAVPSLGATTVPVSPIEAAASGGGGVVGERITAVTPGGVADNAGLKVGDVLTQIDGQQLNPQNPLVTVLRQHFKPDEKVTVDYARGDTRAQVQFTLATETPSC